MNHPCVDGNERVAFFATDVFLRLNGYQLNVDADQAHRFLIQLLENNQCNFVQLLPWILEHTVMPAWQAKPVPPDCAPMKSGCISPWPVPATVYSAVSSSCLADTTPDLVFPRARQIRPAQPVPGGIHPQQDFVFSDAFKF